jgi:hypothetical protein
MIKEIHPTIIQSIVFAMKAVNMQAEMKYDEQLY